MIHCDDCDATVRETGVPQIVVGQYVFRVYQLLPDPGPLGDCGKVRDRDLCTPCARKWIGDLLSRASPLFAGPCEEFVGVPCDGCGHSGLNRGIPNVCSRQYVIEVTGIVREGALTWLSSVGSPQLCARCACRWIAEKLNLPELLDVIDCGDGAAIEEGINRDKV